MYRRETAPEDVAFISPSLFIISTDSDVAATYKEVH
jgi:hypothetical protein